MKKMVDIIHEFGGYLGKRKIPSQGMIVFRKRTHSKDEVTIEVIDHPSKYHLDESKHRKHRDRKWYHKNKN